MTSPSIQLVNRLATLAAGRNIVWTDQTTVNGSDKTAAEVKSLTGNNIPNSDEGTSLDPGDGYTPLKYFWRVQTRRGDLSGTTYRPYFYSIITPTVLDSVLYRVTIDDGGGAVNSDYTSDGTATLAEILAGLKAAIDVDIAAEGWALTCTNTGAALTLTTNTAVDGWTHQNYAVTINDSTRLTLDTDASTATIEVWYRLTSLTNAYAQFDRYQFPDGNYTLTIARNASGVIDIPGCAAAKVVITDTDGLVKPSIGVAKIET